MSILWIRGPVMRKQINNMTEKITKWFNKMTFASDKSDTIFNKFEKEKNIKLTEKERIKMIEFFEKEDYKLEFNNVYHMQMFSDIYGYANLFFGQEWLIYISKIPQKFITSDNPVIVKFPEKKGFYGPTFLERKHYFALSPDIFIETFYPKKDSGKKIKRKTLLIESYENKRIIFSCNFFTLSQAIKNIFSNDKNILKDINKGIIGYQKQKINELINL